MGSIDDVFDEDVFGSVDEPSADEMMRELLDDVEAVGSPLDSGIATLASDTSDLLSKVEYSVRYWDFNYLSGSDVFLRQEAGGALYEILPAQLRDAQRSGLFRFPLISGDNCKIEEAYDGKGIIFVGGRASKFLTVQFDDIRELFKVRVEQDELARQSIREYGISGEELRRVAGYYDAKIVRVD